MDNVYQKHQASIIAASYGIVAPAAETAITEPAAVIEAAPVQEIQKSETVVETPVSEIVEGAVVETQTAENTEGENIVKSEQNDLATGEDNDLQKGEIADALLSNYGDANGTFKFDKTGKELKEILPKTIAALSVVRDTILAQLGVFQAAAGVAPTEKYASYRIPTVEVLQYSYDLTRRAYNELTSDYEPYSDVQVACNSYNDLAYRLKSVLEDIAACQVIVDNVKDGEKYKLSVSQLIAINIG